MASNPTEVKFSLTRGDSQISFKGVIPKGNLMYRQYCLLPAPKHILKMIISKFVVPVSDWRSVTRPSETTLGGDVR